MFSMWLSGLVYVFRSIYICIYIISNCFVLSICAFLMLFILWNEPYIFIIYQVQYIQRRQCRFRINQNQTRSAKLPRIKISIFVVACLSVGLCVSRFACFRFVVVVIRISCHPSNLNIVEEFSGWRWR